MNVLKKYNKEITILKQEPRLDPIVKAKWVKALRDGLYVQGIGKLRDSKNQCCCLGVLCDIVGPDGWMISNMGNEYTHFGIYGRPSIPMMNSIHLSEDVANLFMRLNDTDLLNFKDIADIIEEGL